MRQSPVRLGGADVALRSPATAPRQVPGGVLVADPDVAYFRTRHCLLTDEQKQLVAARAPVMLPVPGAPVGNAATRDAGGDRR